MKPFSLDSLWWLWVPLFFMAFQLSMEISLPRDVLGVLLSEWGPQETLQFMIISVAFLIAFTNLFRVNWATQKLLGGWIALAALSCFYVAGEEISWGQHIFGWETSADWQGVNDQGETNLHNTSSWLDQKPRLLLFIGIIVGGLIVPFVQKYRPALLPVKFSALYPSAQLVAVALLATLPYAIEEVAEAFDIATFARVSEVQELYMYYFVLLYLWCLRVRELSKA